MVDCLGMTFPTLSGHTFVMAAGIDTIEANKTDGLISGRRRWGVYCFPEQASIIMTAPPLTITKDEIDYAMRVFDKALAVADGEARK